MHKAAFVKNTCCNNTLECRLRILFFVNVNEIQISSFSCPPTPAVVSFAGFPSFASPAFSDWALGYPDCAGDRQSPINLSAAVVDVVDVSCLWSFFFFLRTTEE